MESITKVLDKGFVKLIDVMGTDASVVQAARVSYGDGTKTPSDDLKLIKYLWRNKHTSPFEMIEMKFHIKCPIFVARQWLRHRTANVNEYSGRYSVMSKDFYVPEVFHLQGLKNKQKGDKDTDELFNAALRKEITELCHNAYELYLDMLSGGVAREEARIVLPVNFYTEFYWKIDGNNLLKFLILRNDEHAQYEIIEYAKVIEALVAEKFPMCYEAFKQ